MRDQLCTRALIILAVGVTVLAEAASGRDVISEGINHHDLHLQHNDDELRVDKIIGGRVADENAHPYMVQVQRQTPDPITGRLEWNKFCGGTLISKKWVLTAAHCVDEDPRKNRVRVYLYGGFRLDGLDFPYENEKFAVERVKRNGRFDLIRNKNDIALLELEKAVSTGGHRVNTARLDDDTTTRIDGENCVVAGWGYTVPGRNPESVSNVLKEAPMALTNPGDCGRKGEWAGNLCARSIINSASGCPAKGDSGGPLMCLDIDTDEYVQVGIFEGARELDCHLNVPALFTKVAAYRGWIRTATGGV